MNKPILKSAFSLKSDIVLPFRQSLFCISLPLALSFSHRVCGVVCRWHFLRKFSSDLRHLDCLHFILFFFFVSSDFAQSISLCAQIRHVIKSVRRAS